MNLEENIRDKTIQLLNSVIETMEENRRSLNISGLCSIAIDEEEKVAFFTHKVSVMSLMRDKYKEFFPQDKIYGFWQFGNIGCISFERSVWLKYAARSIGIDVELYDESVFTNHCLKRILTEEEFKIRHKLVELWYEPRIMFVKRIIHDIKNETL
jgi:hypothetical protein